MGENDEEVAAATYLDAVAKQIVSALYQVDQAEKRGRHDPTCLDITDSVRILPAKSWPSRDHRIEHKTIEDW